MSEELERQLVELLQAQAARDERLASALERLEKRLAESDATVLTIEEAGKRLGCGRTRVFGYIKDGLLVKVKHGRDTLVTVESVNILNGTPRRARR